MTRYPPTRYDKSYCVNGLTKKTIHAKVEEYGKAITSSDDFFTAHTAMLKMYTQLAPENASLIEEYKEWVREQFQIQRAADAAKAVQKIHKADKFIRMEMSKSPKALGWNNAKLLSDATTIYLNANGIDTVVFRPK